MAELRDWSETAGSNNMAPPDGFPEGMAYQAVNNAAREVMAVIARQHKNTSGELTSTGTAGALTVTPYGTYASLSDGDRFSFTLHLNVNANATLKVGAPAAAALQDRAGAAIAADVLSSGDIVDVVYRSSAWRTVGISNPAAAAVGSDIATGMIVPYASGTLPAGFLACNGAAVSRTTYADLFTVIGVTFGLGDGVTTFNLPDLQDRFPLGEGSNYTLGDDGGSALGFLPNHTHGSGSLDAASGGVHSHSYYDGFPSTASASKIWDVSGTNDQIGHHGQTRTSSTAGNHDHVISGSTASTGDGANTDDDAMPPYTVVSWIIKT